MADQDRKFRLRVPRRRAVVAWLLILVVVVPAVPGCRGCGRKKTPEEIAREKAEEERRKREEEERKRVFDVSSLAPRPHESKLDRPWYYFKPGHWTAATLRARANHFSVVGELDMATVDLRGRRLGLDGVPYTLATLRSIALPEKQPKYLETLWFPPRSEEDCQISFRIQGRGARGGRYEAQQMLRPLKSYQSVLVVLATAPGDYRYLKTLSAVGDPTNLADVNSTQSYYDVRLVPANRQTALPSNALAWTSVAYVVIGEIEPESLRRGQQQAMVDWLHWGGQLILSGPEALEPLRHTLLADYLPATRQDARKLAAEDFQELNGQWTRPVRGQPGRPLHPVRPWPGISWDRHPEARALPGTGGLVVERRVGRGRVVATAFRLSQRELAGWPGLDGFFNGCLLRRPPRKFSIGDQAQPQVTWAGGQDPFDPRLLNQVRLFSRDAGRKFQGFYRPPPEDSFVSYGGYVGYGPAPSPVTLDEPAGENLASWDDFSPVARAARKSLLDAAAIEIPDRWFVVWVVGGYLLVLVPLNWFVCRLIGRVELAWVVAPVIAIVWTGLVIRLARLDIGFARSQTEISVVEVHAGYPRAHVSRYLALYTSLSTTYQVTSEDPGAVVLPFPKEDRPEASRFGRDEIRFRYGKEVELSGLFVQSNTTGLAHGEQIVDLGGTIRRERGPDGPARLMNQTRLTLREARVLRKDRGGRIHVAHIGTLQPGEAAPIKYAPTEEPAAGPAPSAGPYLEGLLNLAQAAEDLRFGEERMVAWASDPIAGMTVHPEAPQVVTRSVVVAHLRYGFGPDPSPDWNSVGDVADAVPAAVPVSSSLRLEELAE